MVDAPDQSFFEARYSPWRLLLLVLLSLGFVAIGLWLIGAFGEEASSFRVTDAPRRRRLSPEMVYLVGWINILFFGLIAVVLLRKAMTGGVAVRVDQVGLYDSKLSDNPVPWASVEAWGSYSLHRTKLVGLQLRNLENLNLSRMARASAGANRTLTGYPYAVTMAGTDKSHDDLVEAFKHFSSPNLTSAL